MQHLLIKIGRALNLSVHVAKNDRHKSCDGETFAQLTLADLPIKERMHQDVYDTIALIDVLWLNNEGRIVSAFEVEKSTSIYSGILRMEDLMRSLPDHNCSFFLVAPDSRENDVVAQFQRPAFKQSLSEMSLSYIPFSELKTHCEGLCKFGDDHKIMHKIARHCTCSN
jgi:type II restriction enzyme